MPRYRWSWFYIYFLLNKKVERKVLLSSVFHRTSDLRIADSVIFLANLLRREDNVKHFNAKIWQSQNDVMEEKVIGRKATCCFFLHRGHGYAFCLDNSNTSSTQFPNPLALSEAENLSKFTWVFFCRWSIRATARRPEDNWLFTSKMQLLHKNKILSLTGPAKNYFYLTITIT